jgi:hypothetical protein
MRIDQPPEQGSVEVRIFRHGALIDREVCESVEEASDVVDAWAQAGADIECEVDDLSYDHHQGEIEEPELPLSVEEEH